MRIALIHQWNQSSDVGDRIWSALCRTWPHADRFTSDVWQSTDARHWQGTAPRRLQLMEQGLPRHHQLLSHLPRATGRATALLDGYDLVLSTSPAAASQVWVEPGVTHACFVGTEHHNHPQQSCHQLPRAPGTERSAAVRQLESESGQSAAGFRIAHHEESYLPSLESGVTHFLMTTHAVAAQHHQELGNRPHAVLYPPIDTTFFRPGADTHENYYLLVCHPGTPTDVGLVIEACELAGRDLVILGGEELREMTGRHRTGQHSQRVTWEPIPQDAELRSRIRRSRALLSVTTTGFDPALVEAQACGTPVIALHSASAEETMLDAERTGLGTGLFFHSCNCQSLVSAIHELERRPQNISAVLSLAQSEKFSPAHFEQGLLSHLARWTNESQSRLTSPATLLLNRLTNSVAARRKAA